MNDATLAKIKKRIEKIFHRWRSGAGFSWWRIHLVWDRGDHSDCTDSRSKSAAANVWERWDYREATITFYVGRLVSMTDDELEDVIVHELSHLLVGAIRDYSTEDKRQMTEFTVQTIANSLRWAYEMGTKAKPKKKPQTKAKPRAKRRVRSKTSKRS